MSRNYKFHNPEGLYFGSFVVVGWLAVFTRNEYKDLVLASLEFCQKKEDYKYSSFPDYAGEKGLLDGVVVYKYFKL